MNEQLASINNVLKSANAILSNINKKDKEYNKLNATLQSINETTESVIKVFDADKKKIAFKLSEANKFYTQKYLPFATKINDSSNDLSAKLRETKKDYDAYKKAKADCESKFKEIADIAKNCKAKSMELAKIEATITKFLKRAETNITKIDRLLIKAKEADSEINLIHKNLIEIEKTSQKSKDNIVVLEDNSNSLNEKIIKYHETSGEKLKAIQKIYDIAHETGLSGEFEKRRNDLNKEIKRWEKYVLWTSVLLLAGVIILFVCQYIGNGCEFDEVFDLNFYVRFLIFSPVVYYLYFVSTEHNKAKKLHDKYAFKTTLSMTIKSHIELLTQNGYFEKSEDCDKILDFILDGFHKIYSEPYGTDNYKMKIKLANFEIDLQKKLIEKLSKITGFESSNNTFRM